jgi:D-glycero-D-manno-heptose 1,7-bisphosphate phosphatase
MLYNTHPRLILLDRDGVINEDRTNYVKTPCELVLIRESANAIRRLNRAGFKIAVATNQSCIARGIITEQALAAVHDHLLKQLQAQGAHIDRFYVCPDAHPSPRRKPAPGMLLEALADFGANPSKTYFVGDALRDLEAAVSAHCRPVLVKTGKGEWTLSHEKIPVHTLVFPDLDAASDYIIQEGLKTA